MSISILDVALDAVGIGVRLPPRYFRNVIQIQIRSAERL